MIRKFATILFNCNLPLPPFQTFAKMNFPKKNWSKIYVINLDPF